MQTWLSIHATSIFVTTIKQLSKNGRDPWNPAADNIRNSASGRFAWFRRHLNNSRRLTLSQLNPWQLRGAPLLPRVVSKLAIAVTFFALPSTYIRYTAAFRNTTFRPRKKRPTCPGYPLIMSIRYTWVARHYKEVSSELWARYVHSADSAFAYSTRGRAPVCVSVVCTIRRWYISNVHRSREKERDRERKRKRTVSKYIGWDVYIPPTMSITPRVTRRLYERMQLAPDVKRRTSVSKFDGATRAPSITSEISPSLLFRSETSTTPLHLYVFIFPFCNVETSVDPFYDPQHSY